MIIQGRGKVDFEEDHSTEKGMKLINGIKREHSLCSLSAQLGMMDKRAGKMLQCIIGQIMLGRPNTEVSFIVTYILNIKTPGQI